MQGHFGWKYKGKHKDLKAAYAQLLQYRESLENPPLLVVCNLDRFEIHTNFTGTAKRVYAFDLSGLTEPSNLDTLRRLLLSTASVFESMLGLQIARPPPFLRKAFDPHYDITGIIGLSGKAIETAAFSDPRPGDAAFDRAPPPVQG